MDLSRYVVDAVVLEGRSASEVARAHGLSASWVCKLVRQYNQGGYKAIEPKSRRPHNVPARISEDLEDEIVLLRKRLLDDGLDAGAETIHYHLGRRHDKVPSVSTIWRTLKRRGFVTAQPHKRPRSSWIRFEALLPNETWQSDMTHWHLVDLSRVDIVNILDDCSRTCVNSRAFKVATATAVVATFCEAGEKWGFPASHLSDNGCIFTARHRSGLCALESEMIALGVVQKLSTPYHPQTCGKVERFHQTLKRYLAKQPAASTVEELQEQIDRFVEYYNRVRPHRALSRQTPLAAFEAKDKAYPTGPKIRGLGKEVRVRKDRVDQAGTVTLRYRTRLHHIGVGRNHKGRRILMLVAGLNVRVLTEEGEFVRELTMDPSKDYQGRDREV